MEAPPPEEPRTNVEEPTEDNHLTELYKRFDKKKLVTSM